MLIAKLVNVRGAQYMKKINLESALGFTLVAILFLFGIVFSAMASQKDEKFVENKGTIDGDLQEHVSDGGGRCRC